MENLMQVSSDELAALRARLAGDVVPCERCGEDDPWQRCRDADYLRFPNAGLPDRAVTCAE